MTEVEKQDVDKMEQLINGADKMVKAGEKVMADGEINWMDAPHAPELIEGSIEFVKALMAYRELLAEAKDIDAAELAKIGALLLGK